LKSAVAAAAEARRGQRVGALLLLPLAGMVQAWVGQKLANMTFYEFFDVRFYKNIWLLLIPMES
jgi:hypothetical protein